MSPTTKQRRRSAQPRAWSSSPFSQPPSSGSSSTSSSSASTNSDPPQRRCPDPEAQAWSGSPFSHPSDPSSSSSSSTSSSSPISEFNNLLPLEDYVRKFESRHFPLSLPSSSSSFTSSTPDQPILARRTRNAKKAKRGMVKAPTSFTETSTKEDGEGEERRNEVGSNGARWKGKGRARTVAGGPIAGGDSAGKPGIEGRVERRMERANRVSQTPSFDSRNQTPAVDTRNQTPAFDKRNQTPAFDKRKPEAMQRANKRRRGGSELTRKSERDLGKRAEGSGGNDGVVLEMEMVGGGVFDVAYVLPVTVGRDSKQTFSVQVDTGSSDLWIASSSCSTAPCSKVPRKYDTTASGSTATGEDFTIDYLQGHVDGPVVWDRVNVGGYEVENQAVAAGVNILQEPLSPQFAGILGLALPLNSVIAQRLPPVMSNEPDGAAWASNLFGITPYANAPMQRFIGMLLERPGSSRIPSLLGIGRHPSLVYDRTLPTPELPAGGVEYSTLVSERTGTLFWKTSVRAITVWVGEERREVDVGRGVMGSVFPSAVLDSGVPLILASGRIANAVWGAVGVSPSADGMYYIPCKTPLNMTITLDDRTPIPLHPLDLTSPPETSSSPVSSSESMCVGLLQSADSHLGRPNAIGDMVLGVPFLRNVYSVMAYAAPKEDGTFERPWPEGMTGEEEIDDTTTATNSSTRPGNVMPRLGLMSMTDPTVALEEFNTVRVLNRPISDGGRPGGGGSAGSAGAGNGSGRALSVGIIVLIALVSFFAACFALFGVRWWLIRRKYGKGGAGSVPASGRNTPLPWGGFGLGGGGGGANGSVTPLDSEGSGMESDEAKLAKMLGGMGGLGMGGGGYLAAKSPAGKEGREKVTYPPRPSESTIVAPDAGKVRDSGVEVRTSESSGVYSDGGRVSGDGGDVTVSELVNASKSSDALVRSQPSMSTFRSSEDRDVVAMAWPADTATLASKSSRARLREQERARNDSSVLPLRRYGGRDEEEVPPLPSSSLANRDSRMGGEEDMVSASIDSYYASASPLAAPSRHSQLPHQMQHRPAPSFPPSRVTSRTHDSSAAYASPLPSSTLGEFGEGSTLGHRSSRSVPSTAWGTRGTDSMASFYYPSGVDEGKTRKKISVGGVLSGELEVRPVSGVGVAL